jgi:RNA polymerase sigma-70 factor (ECF subfamily)
VSSFPAARFPALPLRKEHDASDPFSQSNIAATEELSDESLITRICIDDKEALGLLFRRYARLVHGVGRRILRDNAEAEDLVQEMFLYIARKARLYDSSRGSVRTWLVQTCYYRALIRRTQLHARHYYSPIDLREGEEREQVKDASPPPYDRSGEGLFGRDGWRELLLSLTEDQWETIRLHFYEGHTFAEIAVRRNESVGNVRNHFYRGINRLRQRMKELGALEE